MSNQPKRARNWMFEPIVPPSSKLGQYRLLSPSCGLRVSPLCLGAMNFGTAWRDQLGDMSKETCFEILDYFYEQGGNFIDTANNYQNGQSEEWIGEWLQKTGRRDDMVIATKYTGGFKLHQEALQPNYFGNSRKSMFVSVEASLKKLQTSYIDIFYVHWWDHTTPVEEVMQGLNHLVSSGKVMYLGISDTPAWIVAKANLYAKLYGLAPFVVYQGMWSVGSRDIEREILPMCKAEGLGIAPFGVLGNGKFKTEEQLAEVKATGEKTRNMSSDVRTHESMRPLVQQLQKIATKKNSTVTGVAQAYVLGKAPYVFPIIGCRKLEYLKAAIASLENVSLTDDEVKELEAANPIDLGFPHTLVGTNAATCPLAGCMALVDHVKEPKAIQY